MKEPDEIYIPLFPNHSLEGYHLGDDWLYEPQRDCDNVKYIRADLVEKLLSAQRQIDNGMPKDPTKPKKF